jgi:hypothetical protein
MWILIRDLESLEHASLINRNEMLTHALENDHVGQYRIETAIRHDECG